MIDSSKPGGISILDTTPRHLAVVRVTTVLSQWPSQFRHALDKVYDAVKAGHVRKGGHNVMLYHPRPDGLVDIECGIETAGPIQPAGYVVPSQTPSGPAAAAVHVGPYELLGLTHRAIADWSRRNGHTLTGTCWEVYGDWTEDPAQLQTTIFHTVTPE